MSQRVKSIVFIAPQLYGAPGGVQAYMRRLLEILALYATERRLSVQCLSLNDQSQDRSQHSNAIENVGFTGCGRDKVFFLRKAIALSKKARPAIALVGHVHQAPVAWVLKHSGLIRSYLIVLHGIEAWKRQKWLRRKSSRSAHSIVATTYYTARVYGEKNGINPNRFKVIPLSLGIDVFEEPRISGKSTQVMTVLTVTRMSTADRDKGVDSLILALGKLVRDGVMVRLHVVGTGDDLPRLREIARSQGVEDRVVFFGTVSDEELLQRYAECDVFAMPSKKEGFGIVFMEAMRFAKPCIGGEHGGIPEVIEHGVTGYLVQHGAVDKLSQCLREMYDEPDLRIRMGRNAWKKVSEQYAFSRMRRDWSSWLDGSIIN